MPTWQSLRLPPRRPPSARSAHIPNLAFRFPPSASAMPLTPGIPRRLLGPIRPRASTATQTPIRYLFPQKAVVGSPSPSHQQRARAKVYVSLPVSSPQRDGKRAVAMELPVTSRRKDPLKHTSRHRRRRNPRPCAVPGLVNRCLQRPPRHLAPKWWTGYLVSNLPAITTARPGILDQQHDGCPSWAMLTLQPVGRKSSRPSTSPSRRTPKSRRKSPNADD